LRLQELISSLVIIREPSVGSSKFLIKNSRRNKAIIAKTVRIETLLQILSLAVIKIIITANISENTVYAIMLIFILSRENAFIAYTG
jgi:hypothetical protein